MYTYIYKYTHTYTHIHTYIHTYKHYTYMHTYIYTYMRAWSTSRMVSDILLSLTDSTLTHTASPRLNASLPLSIRPLPVICDMVSSIKAILSRYEGSFKPL